MTTKVHVFGAVPNSNFAYNSNHQNRQKSKSLKRYSMQTFEQIICGQNCPFTDAFFIDLKMLHFFEGIIREETEFYLPTQSPKG